MIGRLRKLAGFFLLITITRTENIYRGVASLSHNKRHLYIRFVGTHRSYDEIDAETI